MIVILIFIFIATSINAQNNLDSVFAHLQNQPDSVKISELKNFISENKNDSSLLAVLAGQKIIQIADSLNDINLIAETMNLVGEINWQNGQFEQALNLFLRALTIAREANNWQQTAYALKNIGMIYRNSDSYKRAENYILQAKEIFDENNDKIGLAICDCELGLTYRRQNKFSKALQLFFSSEKLFSEAHSKDDRIRLLILIAETYYREDKFDRALEFYDKVKNETSPSSNKYGYFSSLNGIARVYNKLNNNEKAIEIKLNVISTAEKINDYNEQISSMCELGILYAQNRKFAEGEKIIRKALSISIERNMSKQRNYCYSSFVKFYNYKSDYKNAFEFSQKYIALNDSLLNQFKNSSVSQMEAIFETSAAEKENAILSKDIEIKEKQRDYWIVITALILLIALIMYNRYRIKKIDTEQLQRLNTMKDTLLRIIAHDLKTPFNVIFGYTEILISDFNSTDDEEKLTYLESIRKASRLSVQLLENLLMWSHSHTGKLEFDPIKIDLSESVFESIYLLESSAETKSIKLESKVPQKLYVTADENMLSTILRNLISNGIKFTDSGGTVKIYASHEKNYVRVVVEDNGVGMDETARKSIFDMEELVSAEGTAGEKGTGFGLVLCKEFVAKHGGKIWVESEAGIGSKFIFTLPSG